MAEMRLKQLLKKFHKDPEYEKEYRKAVQKYIEEGYAEKLSKQEELEDKKQWFLPHHGVFKKSAEKKKIRIVFDATAKFEGKSLNDALLKGPKLQRELPGLLLRFRQKPFAIGADIEAMFSRIRLTKEDARYHRFLLTDENTRETAVYQMNRLTFGDGASPFVAIITLHKTAEDYGEDRARAITAIKENFYMDDYLDSFDTTEEAIQVGKEIKNILSKGDFNLTKWISNSVEGVQCTGKRRKH